MPWRRPARLPTRVALLLVLLSSGHLGYHPTEQNSSICAALAVLPLLVVASSGLCAVRAAQCRAAVVRVTTDAMGLSSSFFTVPRSQDLHNPIDETVNSGVHAWPAGKSVRGEEILPRNVLYVHSTVLP
jgi:hypothetical protein